MKTDCWTKKIGYGVLVGGLITVWGCESVGILGRDTVDQRGAEQRTGIERRGDFDRRDARDRDARRSEISGTVDRIDERSREIHLRTDDGKTTAVRYDTATRAMDGSREMDVASLRRGDRVSIELDRGPRGEQYADAIRLSDDRPRR